MEAKGISILICCYNSANNIVPTLQCLKNQDITHENFEVIIVDNNCTDNTVALAEITWANSPIAALKIVKEPKPGLMHARKTAIAHASYPVLSFIDDDNLVPPTWVSYIFKVFEKKEIGILGVKTTIPQSYQTPNWFSKHENAYAVGDLYKQPLGDVTDDALVFGAGMCIRKEIFEKLAAKQWRSLLLGRTGSAQSAGDDSEICLAARLLGYKIFYTNQISLIHAINPGRLTWANLLKLTEAFGHADVNLLPYNYFFQKSLGRQSFIQGLRKFWWINYLGKTLSIFKLKILKNLGKIGPDDFEIAFTRVNSFRKFILQNKNQFSENFKTVHRLLL